MRPLLHKVTKMRLNYCSFGSLVVAVIRTLFLCVHIDDVEYSAVGAQTSQCEVKLMDSVDRYGKWMMPKAFLLSLPM